MKQKGVFVCLLCLLALLAGCGPSAEPQPRQTSGSGADSVPQRSSASDTALLTVGTTAVDSAPYTLPVGRLPYVDSFPKDFKTPEVEILDDTMPALLSDGHFFLSDTEGWAAYQYGMASGIPNVALSFTRDQGETWERRCELSYYPTGIFFLDESVGIVVGNLDLRERYLDRSRFYVFFQYTKDGGATWSDYFPVVDFESDRSDVRLGDFCETLFPVGEFPQYEDLLSAAHSIGIVPIDRGSASVVFRYEKDGVQTENRAVFDRTGLRPAGE